MLLGWSMSSISYHPKGIGFIIQTEVLWVLVKTDNVWFIKNVYIISGSDKYYEIWLPKEL